MCISRRAKTFQCASFRSAHSGRKSLCEHCVIHAELTRDKQTVTINTTVSTTTESKTPIRSTRNWQNWLRRGYQFLQHYFGKNFCTTRFATYKFLRDSRRSGLNKQSIVSRWLNLMKFDAILRKEAPFGRDKFEI